jgi:iron-sulfur cluster repair protein YtfE (RIC family)
VVGKKFVAKDYLMIHQALRNDLQAFEEATGNLARLTDTFKLAQWFDFFWARLREQHEIEETVAFPKVAERSPTFVAQVLTLAAEHDQINSTLEEINTIFEAIPAIHIRQRPVLYRRLYALATRLRIELKAHLDREERIFIPAVALNFSCEEQFELEAQMRAALPVQELELFLPWLLSSTDEQGQENFLMRLPWQTRLVHRVSWKKKYQKLVEPVYHLAERSRLQPAH